jgi:hypothetical protein
MRQIVINLLLFLVWLLLTAGLVRGIHEITERTPLGAGTAFALWIVGQFVLLSPIVWGAWRTRNVGAR